MPAVSIPVTTEGATPEVSLVSVTNQLFVTDTVVAADGTYSSPPFGNDNIYLLRGRVVAEKAGTLVFQVSDDGVTWDEIYSTDVDGATVHVINDVPSGGIMQYTWTDTSGDDGTYFRFSVYAVKVDFI